MPIFQSFIEENHAHKLESRQTQHNQLVQQGTVSQDLMSYWGYKFETISLLPAPWAETSRDYIESREDLTVSNSAQYCSVVKTGIGESKLILGGEVDAIWDTKPPDPSSPINWVELKTAATPLSDRDILKYERKLLKFWIQSFVLGVPKIIVGFRSKEGVLQSLEELETAQIPRLVKAKGKGSWDGNVCINFTAVFLDCMVTSCDFIVLGWGACGALCSWVTNAYWELDRAKCDDYRGWWDLADTEKGEGAGG
ncbi:MAG: hypothetical protein Q9188_004246 [Gyalolechia gomerana]